MREEAHGALQKSHDLLNQANQLQNDVKGTGSFLYVDSLYNICIYSIEQRLGYLNIVL